MSISTVGSDTVAINHIVSSEIHNSIGLLTRQLHNALNGLGLIARVQDLAGEIPDAKSRLTYIARLTGEAAEKVLNRVEQAKAQNEHIANEAYRLGELIIQDPVGAVAKGNVLNFMNDVDNSSKIIDQHLTEIMMAQDFHDLTGQVIAKVMALAANIEEQLVQLLIQTAPMEMTTKETKPSETKPYQPLLEGPFIQSDVNADVVTSQTEVDDLLASMGF
jgi:chemotaxis protein CheZ